MRFGLSSVDAFFAAREPILAQAMKTSFVAIVC